MLTPEHAGMSISSAAVSMHGMSKYGMPCSMSSVASDWMSSRVCYSWHEHDLSCNGQQMGCVTDSCHAIKA